MRTLLSPTRLVWSLTLSVLTLVVYGQTPAASLTNRLVGKPLYLRGFYMADKLRFDGAGQLLGASPIGPLTLSGVDVEQVTRERDELIIHGVRVALVAQPGDAGVLERRKISSTTHIAFSLRRGDKSNFHAPEEIEVKVKPDAQGSFDQALAKIFANNLAELSDTVPLYWQCYANSYFRLAVISPDAKEQVTHCVITPLDGSSDETEINRDGQTLPPSVIASVPPQIPVVASEIGASGIAVVHVRIRPDGIPVGLQIVTPIGAGVDEAVLLAVSHYRFMPATRSGTPVAMNMNISFKLASGR